jgi:hypothetical protein
MTGSNKVVDVTSEKQRRHGNEAPVAGEQAETLARAAGLADASLTGAGHGSDEDQAGLLGGRSFQTAQRRALATQIGRVHGNRHLQRVIAATRMLAPIQRDDGGGAEAGPHPLIPDALRTSVDITGLSDDELRRRSELILDTLGLIDEKTPETQRLEDEAVRIAAEVARRPSDVGRRIVENYEASARKTPGGRCYAVALARVKQAYRDILGEDLTESMPEGTTKSAFDRLWGSIVRPKRTWLELPEDYRGKGAPGAMAYAGKGSLVDQGQIWAGALLPGAVLQTWVEAADFARVKAGQKPQSYGHSFIFLRYKRADDKPDGKIEGMEIADQGFQSEGVVEQSAYDYWVAANVSGNLPAGRGEGNEALVSGLLSGRNRINESAATNFNLAGGARFKLDPARMVAEIKRAAEGFSDRSIKQAIESLNPDRFNVYFSQLVALYQLGVGAGVDGRFGDGTCRRLVGKTRRKARALKTE